MKNIAISAASKSEMNKDIQVLLHILFIAKLQYNLICDGQIAPKGVRDTKNHFNHNLIWGAFYF